MAKLAPSLKAAFAEIDAAWPGRDRRTDGWIGDSRHCPGSSDHCADANGWVHAIDIDKDGIDPAFVIARLSKYPVVIHYVNFNRKRYHSPLFKPTTLGGSDPHTGHIHVSIFRNGIARSYTQGFGIIPFALPGMPPLPPPQTGEEAQFSHAAQAFNIGYAFAEAGAHLEGRALQTRQIRSL